MARTNARRVAVSKSPKSTPDSATVTRPTRAVRAKPSERMGFDWGGGTDAPRPTRGIDGLPRWPAARDGALGWPYSGGGPLGFGYHRDLPDFRDFRLQPRRGDVAEPKFESVIVSALHAIQERNQRFARRGGGTKDEASRSFPSALLRQVDPPPAHDLRQTGSFSPVENQGDIGSCTAQAVIGLVEYLMNEGGVGAEDMSRMFLYRVTRRLLGWTGDTGAYIRTTIKAMVLFGCPPEAEWPYDKSRLDTEPDAYHYSFAQSYRALTYVRLDDGGAPAATLDALRRTLFDGHPVVFGFPVYDSIDYVGQNDQVVPFPMGRDRPLGGHAVLAVGYDDEKVDPRSGAKGALLFRNSWGSAWGEDGYAWLPYAYVMSGMANDFWTIFNRAWLNVRQFD